MDGFRFNGDNAVLCHQVCVVGPNIDQRLDGFTGGIHRFILQHFTNIIQQHNSHRLGIFANAKSTDRSNRHQKVFIKKFAVHHIFRGFFQHRKTYRQIGNQTDNQFRSALKKE